MISTAGAMTNIVSSSDEKASAYLGDARIELDSLRPMPILIESFSTLAHWAMRTRELVADQRAGWPKDQYDDIAFPS